jgi:hypothetical protein
MGLMIHAQERLARLLDVGGVRLANGTALAVAAYAGCEKRSHLAGLARYGYAKSEHRFIWGGRLILPTDERGLPLGYTIVPANEYERDVFGRFALRHPGRGGHHRQRLLGGALPKTARSGRGALAHSP